MGAIFSVGFTFHARQQADVSAKEENATNKIRARYVSQVTTVCRARQTRFSSFFCSCAFFFVLNVLI